MKSENFISPNRMDRLFDILTEQTLSDSTEIRTSMEEQDIDPQAVIHHGRALISRLKGKAELVIAKQRTIKRYEWAKQQVLQRLETIPNPAEFLANLLAQRGQTALQANFRKVQNLSDQELLDMISEVELLYIFDELDNTDSSEDK